MSIVLFLIKLLLTHCFHDIWLCSSFNDIFLHAFYSENLNLVPDRNSLGEFWKFKLNKVYIDYWYNSGTFPNNPPTNNSRPPVKKSSERFNNIIVTDIFEESLELKDLKFSHMIQKSSIWF